MALDAIREELTTTELAKKNGVHPMTIRGRSEEDQKTIRYVAFPTNTAIANLASAFGGASSPEPQVAERDVARLHAKTGQCVMERNVSTVASGLGLRIEGKRR